MGPPRTMVRLLLTRSNSVCHFCGFGFTHNAMWPGAPATVWAIFVALTALHIFANVRAMRCLQLSSLNRPRLALLLRHYIATQASTSRTSQTQAA